VIVVVLLALLAVLAPMMARQVTSDAPLLTSSSNKHAALAAAEAGIQWYRVNLDSHSAYFNYSSSNPPPGGDLALTGYCGAGQSSTCDLQGTSPPEAFHYVPTASTGCTNVTVGQTCTVVVEVTGRAGSAGNYVSVYAEATFGASSVLNDAYYSNFEVLDPLSQTIQGIDVTTSAGVHEPEAGQGSLTISYGTVSNVSVWQATCQYTTYSPNTFIDSLGTVKIGNTNYTYSSTNPYYGPYEVQNSPFSFQLDGNGNVVTSGGVVTVNVPAMPCNTPFDFVSSETFDGPVYTNDQLHICGSPTFNGSPVSLTSGAPSDVPYLYVSNQGGSPPSGSVLVTSSNSGTNGPYPTSLIGQYVPGGYTTDAVNCNGGSDNPNLAHGVELNGTQSLPSLNTQLANYGTTSPPSGSATGCTYEGPTMIELVTTNGTTTMNVWSPLSSTPLTTSTCSGGSSFSTTSPLVTNIPLPADGVVYVRDYTPPTGSIVPTVNDGSAPCFNPYQAAANASSTACLEGDAYIEGELSGQLTVASAANIIITRDLTYACTDTSGVSGTNPSSVSGCSNENNPDILGLSAEEDVLVSHNDPTDSVTQSTQDCVLKGFGNGTGSPVNTPSSSMLSGDPYNGTQITGAQVTASSAQVTDNNGFNGVPSDTNLTVTGTGIPAGTTVVSVSGNTLVLSANATKSGNVTLTFTDPGLQNDPAAIWPTMCDATNIYIDASIFALSGSFGVQNWDDSPFSSYVNLNGTDLSEFRGPFGVSGGGGSGTDGYEKRVSFDQRLEFIAPPFVIPGSVPLWVVENYIACPNSSCPAIG